MNFYSFDDINAAACCLRFANEVLPGLGYEVRGDRIQAKWRGGDGFNVAVNEHGWYDHKTKDKGGVISLCALAKFGGDDSWRRQQAQEFLGQWLGLAPKFTPARLAYDYHTQSLRYKQLVAEGYHEAKKYVYTNADGIPCHFTIRMEHSTKPKEFFQCTPYSSSLKDADLHLYNLPAISGSDWVVVVEGEKDADTLIGWGIPATTCNNGAANWRDSYTDELRGKDVVICRDNDAAGAEHARVLLRALASAAKSLRVVCPSKAKKGDVTDWAAAEGGTPEKFYAIVKAAPLVSAEEAAWSDEEYAIYKAKEANKTPFSNVVTDTRSVNGKERQIDHARTINDLVEDVHTRFLGFPMKLGDYTMFDHDRDTKRIETIDNRDSLFAWIGQKSKRCVNWKRLDGAVSKGELYFGLLRVARRFEKTSDVPDFPRRDDVYYTFRDELKPTPNHEALAKFLSFFCPEGPADAALLSAFVAAPLYFRRGVQRPCWIFDSHVGRGVGKTTIVNCVANLYGCSPICTSRNELEHDVQELLKRIVSTSGRNSRVVLLDNVRGTFDDPQWSDLVTAPSISGRAPYGHGEESRPNDLTFAITSNSANIGSDVESRSFIVFLRRPDAAATGGWGGEVARYIGESRLAILGDVYDILSTAEPPPGLKTYTRVPDFEREVVFPMCGSAEAFDAAMEHMMAMRKNANVDMERALNIVDEVRDQLKKTITGFNPDTGIAFIRSDVMNHWVKSMKMDMQDVWNMVNSRQIEIFHREIKAFPSYTHHPLHRRGIMYIGPNVLPESADKVPILRLTGEKSVVLAGEAEGGRLRARLSKEGWFARASSVVEVPVEADEPADADIDAYELEFNN